MKFRNGMKEKIEHEFTFCLGKRFSKTVMVDIFRVMVDSGEVMVDIFRVIVDSARIMVDIGKIAAPSF